MDPYANCQLRPAVGDTVNLKTAEGIIVVQDKMMSYDGARSLYVILGLCHQMITSLCARRVDTDLAMKRRDQDLSATYEDYEQKKQEKERADNVILELRV